jgi:hypothetical protein
MYLAQGSKLHYTACEATGISKQTFFNWLNKGKELSMKKGKLSDNDKLYVDFFDSIKKAEAEAQAFLLRTIRVKSLEQWQAAAWMLERRWPNMYGRKDRVEVITPDESGNTKVRDIIGVMESMTDDDYANLEKHIEE